MPLTWVRGVERSVVLHPQSGTEKVMQWRPSVLPCLSID